MDRTNIRIVSQPRMPGARTVYGEWFVNPGDAPKLAHIREQFAIVRAEEPSAKAVIQTRGPNANWHNLQP